MTVSQPACVSPQSVREGGLGFGFGLGLGLTSSLKCGVKEVKVFIWRSGGGGLAVRARWRSEVANEMSCRFASSLIGSLPG